MMKTVWSSVHDADGNQTTEMKAYTPLGRATVERDAFTKSDVFHLYLDGVHLGEFSKPEQAFERLDAHLEGVARRLIGDEAVHAPKEALIEAMTTLAQGEYARGAAAAFQISKAALTEAHRLHPDARISFDDAVTFLASIEEQVRK